MKKLQLLLFAGMIVISPAASSTIEKTAYFEANSSLGGEVKILKSSKSVLGDESFTRFDVYASESGKYFINFWMLPPQLADGTFGSYKVKVNGIEQSAKITPAKTGWQLIHLDGNAKVSLNVGINTIIIVGTIPEIPAIEHITMSKLPMEFNQTSDYDKYISDIAFNKNNAVAELSFGENNGGGSIDLPVFDVPYVPFDYEYSEKVDIKYTYHGLFYFNKGETITVKSIAKNNFTHVINLYSLSSPEKYSWYGGTNSSISLVAPISGFYGLMARSSKVGADGFCDLTVNDRYKFVNLPLSMNRILAAQPTDQMYNSFTTNSNVDPILWVEESLQGKVIAMNDDYQEDSDFDWKWDSRINTKYPRPAKTVIVAAANSYTPIGQSDVYAKAKNKTFRKITFPLLKDNDCILSAPDGNYNCIGWSGGVLSVRWPEYEGCDENWLDWYDIFYGTERYPGSPIYTRQGADENNSMIDLWGVKNSTNQPDQNYTHASIRKGGNEFPHGYDWESKTGECNPRVFHPRYSIGGSLTYGEVLERYRLISPKSNYRTLIESIANGESVIESVIFNNAEISLIQSKLNNINLNRLNEFEVLYSAWNEVYKNLLGTNPTSFSNFEEYNDLLSFCRHNDMRYAVYDKLKDGELSVMKLIVDLDYGENQSILNRVKAYINDNRYDDNGAMIIRSSLSFVKRFVKYLIADEIGFVDQSFEVSNETEYSNMDNVNVRPYMGYITTQIDLDKESCVSISLIDKNGDVVLSIQRDVAIYAGHHEFQSQTIRPGVYFVKVSIDGRWNIRKIIVK